MFDETQYRAKEAIIALSDLLEEIKRKHPQVLFRGLREAIALVESTPPDPSITKIRIGKIARKKNPDGRGHILTVEISIPGYTFRLKGIPADPAISLLNTVLLLNSEGKKELVAEQRARRKLRRHISKEQWLSYQLTGAFTEISKRSGHLYLFRRGFPTLVYNAFPEGHRFLTGLCLHAEGYVEHTWVGHLCPTDDVITVLLLMRTDERRFWARAGHHKLDSPALGI